MPNTKYWLQDRPGIIFLPEKAPSDFPRKLDKLLVDDISVGIASIKNAAKTGLPLSMSLPKKDTENYRSIQRAKVLAKGRYCADRAKNPIERVIRAASVIGADPVVLLRGDRPCIPPDFINECVDKFLKLNAVYPGCGYFSTTSRSDTDEYIGGLPDGIDVEILTMQNLIRCYRYTVDKESKKYITNWAKNYYTPHFFNDNGHKFDYTLKYLISKPEDLYPLRETYEICGFNSND